MESDPKGSSGAPSYDTFHYITFASKEDTVPYFNHEEHQAFIARNKDNWDHVQVVDAFVEAEV